jgi:hypothetical protein
MPPNLHPWPAAATTDNRPPFRNADWILALTGWPDRGLRAINHAASPGTQVFKKKIHLLELRLSITPSPASNRNFFPFHFVSFHL